MRMTWRYSLIYLCVQSLWLFARTQQTPDGASKCNTAHTRDGACSWTGDCAIPGCADRCVADLGAGTAATVLYDRAFTETWYALCPRLANIVDIVVRGATGTTAQAGPAPPATPSGFSTGHDQAPAAAPPLADSPEAASARSLLHDDHSTYSFDKAAALDLALAIAASTRPASVAAAHGVAAAAAAVPQQVGRLQRRLHDAGAATPAPDAPPAAELKQECPTPATVKQFGSFLIRVAEEYEDIFAADARGAPLGPTQAQLAPGILDKPNEFAVLVAFMKDPARLAAYLRDRCTTSEVTAAAYLLYDDFFLVRAPPAGGASFVTCRDNFLAMEQHVRAMVDVVDVCTPPFGAAPDCFGADVDIPLTPTTEPCADALAAAYNVTTAAPLRSAATSMRSLHAVCQEQASEAACGTVDATPQRNAIQNAWQTFPMRAPLPGSDPSSNPAAGASPGPPVLVFPGGSGGPAPPAPDPPPPAAATPAPAVGAADAGAADAGAVAPVAAAAAASPEEAQAQQEPVDRSVAVATGGAAAAGSVAAVSVLLLAL
eukprot:jgi/Ulvmu1/8150/UM040_0047.1